MPVDSDFDFQNVTFGEQTWRFHDSGSGKPVVLLHGFPDLPQSYASIARSLTLAGYRAIVPYLRGYHPATIVDDRPYDALHTAEDAIGLLDALGLESAAFVGHDWGASIVWGVAALAPARVDAIIPIAIPHPVTLKPKNALQAAGALALGRHFLFFKTPWADAQTRRNDFAYIEALYERWAPSWKGPERDAALARVKEAFRDPAVLQGAIDYYRALSPEIDHRLLAKPACRGLLVAGEKDFGGHLGPYKKSRSWFEAGAELLVVPHAGHWPHFEAPDLFLENLLDFLRVLD